MVKHYLREIHEQNHWHWLLLVKKPQTNRSCIVLLVPFDMHCNTRGMIKFKLEQMSSGTPPFRREMSCHLLSPCNDAASRRAVGMLRPGVLLTHVEIVAHIRSEVPSMPSPAAAC